MSRILRSRAGALVLALGLAATCVLTAVPGAGAATGSAPVTAPDSGTVYPGNPLFLLPLVNDTDADGDELTICRLGPESPRGLDIEFYGSEVVVYVRPRVKPGTYTFTYYACDFSYLTPGTITVAVEAPPNITVKKIAGKPGKLRVRNPADVKIRFLYGSDQEDEPDGRLAIPRDSSVVITVHRTRIVWIALTRKGDFLAFGRVNGIRLPPGDHPPPAGRVRPPSALARAWLSS